MNTPPHQPTPASPSATPSDVARELASQIFVRIATVPGRREETVAILLPVLTQLTKERDEAREEAEDANSRNKWTDDEWWRAAKERAVLRGANGAKRPDAVCVVLWSKNSPPVSVWPTGFYFVMP